MEINGENFPLFCNYNIIFYIPMWILLFDSRGVMICYDYDSRLIAWGESYTVGYINTYIYIYTLWHVRIQDDAGEFEPDND